MASFELNEMQKMVKDVMHQFSEQDIRPVAHDYDEKEEMPWPVMEKAAAIGLGTAETFGLTKKKGDGGGGESMAGEALKAGGRSLLGAIVSEELAWGCAGITNAINGSGLAAVPVAGMGNDEQKELFIDCMTGKDENGHMKIAAMAMTEPKAGSDISSIQCSAVKDNGNYILNGSKQFITNGHSASIFVVWATVDPKAGRAGHRAFIIPRGTKGLVPGPKDKKLGIRASETSPVFLEDCKVPAGWMLGGDRAGFGGAKKMFDATRPMVAAMAIGIARAAVEYAVQYATEREQFGAPLASKQAIAFMLADMAMSVESARLLVWKSAWMADKQIPNVKEASMGKALAAQVAMDVTLKAVQILGGYGFIRDYPVEKWMRDAKIFNIFEGTGEIQRSIVARELTGVRCL